MSVTLPGAVRTEITRNVGVELPGTGDAEQASRLPIPEPEDAARTIVDSNGSDQLHNGSDRLHAFVGRESRVMNLATRLAPRAATRFIERQMRGLLAPSPSRLP